MIQTVSRKRIEILVDTPLVPRVVAQLKAVDISGCAGAWQQDDVTGASAKTIVLAIASDAKTSGLIEAIAPLLDSYGMLLTIGDVQVVRGERF
jgi:hypothetical protein